MDVSTIQLVGPQTSKEEIQSLYLEVYKQHRLPGSPPREPELMEEVVSSFEDCQGWRQKEVPETAVRSPVNRCLTPKEQNPCEGKERSLCGKKPGQSKGGPSEGTGHGSSPRRGNRVAELPPHQELAGGTSMFQE